MNIFKSSHQNYPINYDVKKIPQESSVTYIIDDNYVILRYSKQKGKLGKYFYNVNLIKYLHISIISVISCYINQ